MNLTDFSALELETALDKRKKMDKSRKLELFVNERNLYEVKISGKAFFVCEDYKIADKIAQNILSSYGINGFNIQALEFKISPAKQPNKITDSEKNKSCHLDAYHLVDDCKVKQYLEFKRN